MTAARKTSAKMLSVAMRRSAIAMGTRCREPSRIASSINVHCAAAGHIAVRHLEHWHRPLSKFPPRMLQLWSVQQSWRWTGDTRLWTRFRAFQKASFPAKSSSSPQVLCPRRTLGPDLCMLHSAKSAMQSGAEKIGMWKLEFEAPRRVEFIQLAVM